MKRHWKTHDLVDLFDSLARGYLPFGCKQFTNYAMDDTPSVEIKQHDVNWPTHMQFKIEDGIKPKPQHRGRPGDPLRVAIRETMAKLAPGQSFFVPVDMADAKQYKSKAVLVASTINAANVKKDKHFISRSYRPPDKPTGFRIWRLN